MSWYIYVDCYKVIGGNIYPKWDHVTFSFKSLWRNYLELFLNSKSWHRKYYNTLQNMPGSFLPQRFCAWCYCHLDAVLHPRIAYPILVMYTHVPISQSRLPWFLHLKQSACQASSPLPRSKNIWYWFLIQNYNICFFA